MTVIMTMAHRCDKEEQAHAVSPGFANIFIMSTLTWVLLFHQLLPTTDTPWWRPPVTRITPPEQLVRQIETGMPAVKVRRSRVELIRASLHEPIHLK
jgi:hypothetical protein